MKKRFLGVLIAFSALVLTQPSLASACDITVVNHTGNPVKAQLWVLNDGQVNLVVHIADGRSFCYKKSDLDQSSWVEDPKSVLASGDVTVYYPNPKDLTGELEVIPKQSAHVPKGSVLHIYEKSVSVEPN